MNQNKMKINSWKPTAYILAGAAIFFIMVLLGGCGVQTTVVLLPETDGGVGEVTVTAKDSSSKVLEKAYQSVSVEKPGKSVGKSKILEPGQVQEMFGEALKIQPVPPIILLLYFESGGTDLTRASEILIHENLPGIKERQYSDIAVIGHSDRVGSDQNNWELSLKRANYVADLLIAEGVDPANIEITSHGETNPLIPTDDDVAEPRNRRVEVVVR